MKQPRIGYIDAMRGFTIFLVVYYHVVLYTFGYTSATWTLNSFFVTFRMPLFFFLSGFLMYKVNQFQTLSALWSFLCKKGKVQLFPTFIFSVLFALITTTPYIYIILDKFKYGYWFTITLFFFFVIYSIGDFTLGRRMHGKEKVIIGAVFTILLYFLSKYSVTPFCPWSNSIFSRIVGIANFQYFIFFYFGALVRANSKFFSHLLRHERLVSIIIIGFIFLQLVLQLPSSKVFFINNAHSLFSLLQSLAGFLGIAVIFIFFRKNAHKIDNCSIGKFLQYIGKRTLDIYLIHHILVFTDIHFIGDFLSKHNSFVTELFSGSIISIIIIVLCLIISSFLRCSNTLARILFGKVIEE